MSSSDENDFFYEDEYEDSGNEEGDDDEDADNDEFGMDIGLGEEQASGQDGAGIGTGSSSESDRKHGEEFAYEVLSSDQIVDSMVEAIKEVNSVMQIPATTVRVLLNHFKWDKEKLMEKYFSDSQEKMFKDAKVTSPFATMTIEASAAKDKADKSTSNSKKEATPKAQVSRECEICYLTLPKSHMTALDCSHYFCNNCWKEYLMVKIVSEGASHSIACPASECDLLVDDVRVVALLTDQKVKVKYQHLIANAFVQCNRLMRWCPAPDCPNAVKAAQVEPRPVKCKCNHTFCFSCSENWHDPVRCTLIKRWIKKCDDDSETSNWISANTKECPKCKATIEKDGGCNHMICRNIACRADFCWVCLGPWEPHGSSWYNCNRYDEDEAKEARGSQEKSRSLLQRYLFYCNRYMNHLQSLKFENKLYSMVKDKMEEMQQHNMSWIEVQFLKKAVDILCECRRTLMYTYVFAYYLQRNNQSQLFEDNQKDLENSTECLSEYLERDISAENLVDIKQKVQDKFRYCENRRKVLLEHVHEGYEKDWWEYTESDIPK